MRDQTPKIRRLSRRRPASPSGERQRREKRAPEPPLDFNLKISSRAAGFLSRIGVPAAAPFAPDAFQLEAVRAVAAEDVIVSAPTGSGKTWVAERAIAGVLAGGGRAWYASPLKALSNAKFLEFGRLFGEERVGLLTGDHKVNPEAGIVIGTTEILRNQLYDAMSGGRDLEADLVVLDEAHYLGDRERGVVWEEVLIYLPARVRLLLLSATVANAADLAAWLERNRDRPVRVVTGGERPVPLAGLCLWPSGDLTTLAEAAGGRGGRRAGRPGISGPRMPNAKILRALREADLLPAIFFLKSRLDCDAAAGRPLPPPRESRERLEARDRLVGEYLVKYPFLAAHPHLGAIRRGAVAAHHAGHLPHYKLLVEDLMSRGWLDAIFATSTVSAGVNFPARTVIIRQSDRFDGQGFSDFSATEFTQMTGRAGRRGRDHIGFVLAVPGPYLNLPLLAGLLGAPPEPVASALAVNFSMVLNLLAAYRPLEIKKLLAASLAAWQQADGGLYEVFQTHLAFLQGEGLVDARQRLTPDGRWAAELRLDHPLIFYAGIKAQAWPGPPALLAAVVAGLAADKESNQPPPRLKPPRRLIEALTRLLLAVGPLMSRLKESGFTVPTLNLRPAWAVLNWASGGGFDEAVATLGLGPGDLAMLALRTADHLRQMAGLTSHPDLAAAAREARFRLLREPVSAPL